MKCLQCGSPLPAEGDCLFCAQDEDGVTDPGMPRTSELLRKDLRTEGREGPTRTQLPNPLLRKSGRPAAERNVPMAPMPTPKQGLQHLRTTPSGVMEMSDDDILPEGGGSDDPTDDAHALDERRRVGTDELGHVHAARIERKVKERTLITRAPERPPGYGEAPAPPMAAAQAPTQDDHPEEAGPMEEEDARTPVYAERAPLWRRLLAGAIDLGAVGAVLVLYLLVASLIAGLKVPASGHTGLDALIHRLHAWEPIVLPGVVLAFVLSVAYGATFSILWNGRTPGRRLLGLQLVDKSGFAPTRVRAITRAVLSVLSFLAFGGGFWMALFDRKGQTLHDKLTGTFVVRPG